MVYDKHFKKASYQVNYIGLKSLTDEAICNRFNCITNVSEKDKSEVEKLIHQDKFLIFVTPLAIILRYSEGVTWYLSLKQLLKYFG